MTRLAAAKLKIASLTARVRRLEKQLKAMRVKKQVKHRRRASAEGID